MNNKKLELIVQKLQAKEYRMTAIRKAVIKVLIEQEHVSVNDIVSALQKQMGNSGETINTMSIYNTIDLLIAEHIIHANVFEGKQIIYELSENSIHIICNMCNKNIHLSPQNQKNPPFNDEDLVLLANNHHFAFSHYKLEIHGICDKCQIKPKKSQF